MTRLAYALAATGDRDAARQLVDQITARPDAHVHAFGLALAAAGLDDLDNAFAWFDRAYDERDPVLHTVKSVPALESLHGDARWKTLLHRIGLTEPQALSVRR